MGQGAKPWWAESEPFVQSADSVQGSTGGGPGELVTDSMPLSWLESFLVSKGSFDSSLYCLLGNGSYRPVTRQKKADEVCLLLQRLSSCVALWRS